MHLCNIWAINKPTHLINLNKFPKPFRISWYVHILNTQNMVLTSPSPHFVAWEAEAQSSYLTRPNLHMIFMKTGHWLTELSHGVSELKVTGLVLRWAS